MTVKELIEQLSKLDRDKEVGIIYHDYWKGKLMTPEIKLYSVDDDNRLLINKKDCTKSMYGIKVDVKQLTEDSLCSIVNLNNL